MQSQQQEVLELLRRAQRLLDDQQMTLAATWVATAIEVVLHGTDAGNRPAP